MGGAATAWPSRPHQPHAQHQMPPVRPPLVREIGHRDVLHGLRPVGGAHRDEVAFGPLVEVASQRVWGPALPSRVPYSHYTR